MGNCTACFQPECQGGCRAAHFRSLFEKAVDLLGKQANAFCMLKDTMDFLLEYHPDSPKNKTTK